MRTYSKHQLTCSRWEQQRLASGLALSKEQRAGPSFHRHPRLDAQYLVVGIVICTVSRAPASQHAGLDGRVGECV